MVNERTCSKIPFDSKSSARKEIKQIKNTQRRGKSSMKPSKHFPYECPCCGLWHLTSIKPKNQYQAKEEG